MARWSERFTNTSYRFMRVDRSTGFETAVLNAFRGGTVTRNDDTRIKESAEFQMVGEVDFGPDLVRVYMTVEWAGGETEDVVLGTFLPVVPGRSIRQGYSTATVRMYGRLQELLDDRFSAPVTVTNGENAIAVAKKVCEGVGLTVVAEPSDYTVTDTRAYGVGANQSNSEVDDTKLGMVNDLLDLAGFRAAYTDPMGRVIFEKYRDPGDIAPSWTFDEDDPTVRLDPAIEEERDYTDAANHVVVIYGPDQDGKTIASEAWDRDPDSQLSTVSRGRTITRAYSYMELPPGKTDGEMQAYADKRASTLLSTAQSVIWRLRCRHPYLPFRVNDTIGVRYPSGNVEGKFQVRAQTLTLGGGCAVDSEVRVFRRRA